jgi:putative N6-adenine-specific DNA methylase
LRWEHLKAEAEKRISIPKRPLVLASDIDRRACNALETVIRGHRFAAAFEITPGDFFELDPQPFARRTGLVVINPPYGRRIDSPKGIRELLQRIGNRLVGDFPGWKFALIVPAQSMLGQIPFPATVFPFFHGGLQVVAAVGKVPPASGHIRA